MTNEDKLWIEEEIYHLFNLIDTHETDGTILLKILAQLDVIEDCDSLENVLYHATVIHREYAGLDSSDIPNRKLIADCLEDFKIRIERRLDPDTKAALVQANLAVLSSRKLTRKTINEINILLDLMNKEK